MPLMRDWTEITVEETLLIPVVQELLAMAENPNHVEVIHGASGRLILAEAGLAERWYQATVAPANNHEVSEVITEVPDGDLGIVDAAIIVATESTEATEDLVPLPVKRGPGRPRKNPISVPPPPLSDGEEL